ncbi:unnamed protein product [Phyllotreta striolata]|uniref:Cytochrome P450 n=1 Tax=Phyllotreta striolata TaxID=444603 RepID=A0A9N9XT18_PHYSR|nr:unnamed protein product [Phyllotreta striolata]
MWIALAAVALATLAWFFIDQLNYWRKLGVPQPSLLFNFKEMFNLFAQRRSFAESVMMLYDMFPEKRFGGIYSFKQPILMIRDPDLLKELTVKNFDHFTDHTNIISEVAEPLWGKNLFALKGKRWREMRPILSPSFTSSKMRGIFTLISECAENFTDFYRNFKEDTIEIELKDSFTRFTNDVIATAAFGVKSDSLTDRDNRFYVMGKEMTSFGANTVSGTMKMLFLIAFPGVFEALNLRIFRKEVADFFINTIEDTVETRKKKGIVRPDMIHLLIEAQKGSSETKEAEALEDDSFAAQTESDLGRTQGVQRELTNMDIAAQAMIFFFAGFESVSSMMCFMGYELAVNEEIQDRLREEILDTLNNNNGKLTYEALIKMDYMDMVVSEVLRKWPAAAAVDRQCTKPYTIQPKLPGEKPVTIELKQAIWIPIFGIHRDPSIYPDPEKFDPERFNEYNRTNIKPFNYIPFGAGPRNCIGSRFALLEIKTVFFHLLANFKLVSTEKSHIPLKLSAKSFNLTAQDGFWFGLEKIND